VLRLAGGGGGGVGPRKFDLEEKTVKINTSSSFKKFG
jgi:hypothetical protein